MSRRQLYELTIQGAMSEVLQAEFADVKLWISPGQTNLRGRSARLGRALRAHRSDRRARGSS